MDLLIGTRIPKDFFVTSGVGESDITVHAGSYHLALKAAGIERCNIMNYSSVLPSIANKVEKPDDFPDNLVHGAVMETISAVANSEKGERATAGIIFGWLFNKTTGKKYGGLVCEYNGNKSEEGAKIQLYLSLNELFANGFSEEYELKDIEVITRTVIPTKKYGTALVALCFLNYLLPVSHVSKEN